MVTLRKVLESLENEENLSVHSLAGKLKDSPEAVQAALTLLEQMGKVQKIPMSRSCGHGCKGCISLCFGKEEEAGGWWELTKTREESNHFV